MDLGQEETNVRMRFVTPEYIAADYKKSVPPPKPGADVVAELQSRVQQLEAQMKNLAPLAKPPNAEEPQPDEQPSTFKPATELSGGVKIAYVDLVDHYGDYKEEQGKGLQRDDDIVADGADAHELAMTIQTYYSSKKERESICIKVHSKPLLSLLRHLLRDLMNHITSAIWSDKMTEIDTEDDLILQSLDHLIRATSVDFDEFKDSFRSDANEETWKELRCFVQHVERYRPQHKSITERDLQKNMQIRYEQLLTLYPPGSQVVATPFLQEPQIFVVYDARYVDYDAATFSISAWMYDWNGTDLVKDVYIFHISEFKNVRSIKSLSCIPLKYYGEVDNLRQKLISRGKEFQKLCHKSHDMLRCSGPVYQALSLRESSEHMPDNPAFNSADAAARLGASGTRGPDRDIVIDPVLFDKYADGRNRLATLVPQPERECNCNLCDPSGVRSYFMEHFLEIDDNSAPPNSDPRLLLDCFLLLPPRVLGFDLKSKVWIQVPVKSIKSAEKENAEKKWADVSLDRTHKANIRKLVSAHIEQPHKTAERTVIGDFIVGKGEGVVILLHGEYCSLNHIFI